MRYGIAEILAHKCSGCSLKPLGPVTVRFVSPIVAASI